MDTFYKHYRIRIDDNGDVAVLNPHNTDHVLYRTDSLAAAKSFVRDYRDGAYWAVKAASAQAAA